MHSTLKDSRVYRFLIWCIIRAPLIGIPAGFCSLLAWCCFAYFVEGIDGGRFATDYYANLKETPGKHSYDGFRKPSVPCATPAHTASDALNLTRCDVDLQDYFPDGRRRSTSKRGVDQ